jgi:hypothetical protein
VNCGGSAKAVLSNQTSTVGLSRLPEPRRFGRWVPTPVFARSLEIVGVNGRPLRQM